MSLLLSSCQNTRPVLQRTNPQVLRTDDLVYSNSANFMGREHLIKRHENSLQIKHRILIKNTSAEKTYDILLSGANLHVSKSRSFPAGCKDVRGEATSTLLAPGRQVQVKCEVKIDRATWAELGGTDFIAWFRVPYSSSGKMKTISLPLRLFVEDFQ